MTFAVLIRTMMNALFQTMTHIIIEIKQKNRSCRLTCNVVLRSAKIGSGVYCMCVTMLASSFLLKLNLLTHHFILLIRIALKILRITVK